LPCLDLKDDPTLIAEYENYHKNVWPEIQKSIRDAGIQKMESTGPATVVYAHGNKRFLFLRTKALADAANPTVGSGNN